MRLLYRVRCKYVAVRVYASRYLTSPSNRYASIMAIPQHAAVTVWQRAFSSPDRRLILFVGWVSSVSVSDGSAVDRYGNEPQLRLLAVTAPVAESSVAE